MSDAEGFEAADDEPVAEDWFVEEALTVVKRRDVVRRRNHLARAFSKENFSAAEFRPVDREAYIEYCRHDCDETKGDVESIALGF